MCFGGDGGVSGRPSRRRAVAHGSLRSPAARRSAEPSLGSLARTPFASRRSLPRGSRPFTARLDRGPPPFDRSASQVASRDCSLCSRVVARIAPPARCFTRPLSPRSVGLAVIRKSKILVITDDCRSSERCPLPAVTGSATLCRALAGFTHEDAAPPRGLPPFDRSASLRSRVVARVAPPARFFRRSSSLRSLPWRAVSSRSCVSLPRERSAPFGVTHDAG